MKRIFFFALTAAFLAFGFTNVLAADARSTTEPTEGSNQVAGNSAAAAPVDLSWISINGGGASYGSSGGTRQIGYSVGQSVAGEGSGGTRKVGIGFWYGAAGAPACAAAKGDLNGVGGLSPADVVLMLNCVFTGNGAGTVGGDCNLCYADVNCLNGLTPSDVVLELLRVFNGQPFPCS